MAVTGQHRYPCPPTRSGRKKGGSDVRPQDEALGRSRGGFSTKLHVSVSGLGLPIELQLTAGQRADVTQGEALLKGYQPKAVIADKGYDSDALVESIEASGAEAVIPSKQNRTEPAHTRSTPVQRKKPGGAVYEPNQAVSPRRHALRKESAELPGVRTRGVDHGAAAVT